jgi:ribosomal protein L11 methyltransferase
MSSSEYFVMNLKRVPTSLEDWLSAEAFSHQALGVSEVLPFTQPEGEEDVFTEIPEYRELEVYFSTPPSQEWIQALKHRIPGVDIQLRGEVSRDWLAEWKKGFKPFSLTSGHWVVPSWCEAPKESEHNIWIDPGMAFGTGTHETTQLVAEEMHRLLSEGMVGSVLDVGTGTGILAILARQLGVRRVVTTEIESDSRRVARENFTANQCADIELGETQVEQLTEKFDVVVANIIDGVLVRIQDELKARVKPGGWLVLSGIILEREQDFLEGFKIAKAWDNRTQKGDWLLYSVRL